MIVHPRTTLLRYRRSIALAILALLPLGLASAQAALPAIAIKTAADGAQQYSLTFQVLILMTVLTLLPAILARTLWNA